MPGIVIGTIQLLYVIICALNKNNKINGKAILHKNAIPLIWNCIFVFTCGISIIWADNVELVYQIIPQLYMRFCLILFISSFFKSKKDITYGILAYLFSCGYMMLKMLVYMVAHPANYFNNVIFYYLRDMNRLKKQFRNIVVLFFMALVVAFFLAKNPVYAERLEIAFQAVFSGKTADLSTTERTFFISLASKMFLERPFLGWGANNFRGILASTGYGNVVYCHNNYLEIASGMGIMGLIANYWFYIYTFFKSVVKVKRVPPIALTISIFSVFFIFEYGIVTYLFPAYVYILTIAFYYAAYE